MYCKRQADDGMVDVRTRPCSRGSCTQTPIFDVEGSKQAGHYEKHTDDVKRPREAENTMKTAWFTSAQQTVAQRILDGGTELQHRGQEGMRQRAVSKHADGDRVNSRTRYCSHHSCSKTPDFNVKGRKTAGVLHVACSGRHIFTVRP